MAGWPNYCIRLPGGCFDARLLVRDLRKIGRSYIIQGQQNVVKARHSKRKSLDYWLRCRFAVDPDTKQAVNSVVDNLVKTGLFTKNRKLKCPNAHTKCKGIEMTDKARRMKFHRR